RKGLSADQSPAYVAELKIDGLSMALTYENGKLVRGATRGDGVRGEEVTHNIRTVRAVPLRLKEKASGRLEVRGEIYLPRKAFERINREREDAREPLFANPRNAAAGTLRNLEPALVAKRGLSALTYQLVQGRPEGRPLPEGAGSKGRPEGRPLPEGEGVEADLQVGLSMPAVPPVEADLQVGLSMRH